MLAFVEYLLEKNASADSLVKSGLVSGLESLADSTSVKHSEFNPLPTRTGTLCINLDGMRESQMQLLNFDGRKNAWICVECGALYTDSKETLSSCCL